MLFIRALCVVAVVAFAPQPASVCAFDEKDVEQEYVFEPALVWLDRNGKEIASPLRKIAVFEGEAARINIVNPKEILVHAERTNILDVRDPGPSFSVMVRGQSAASVLLEFTMQMNRLERDGKGGSNVVGSNIRVSQKVPLDKPVRWAMAKDESGVTIRWVEVTVRSIGSKK